MKKESRFTLAVLTNPGFRLLLLTRLFTAMAGQAQAVIVGWQIYSITHDPWMLGLTGLVEALPALGCALFAGHIVDKHQPKQVYFWCIGVTMINMLCLLALGGGYIELPLPTLLISIYIAIFISGIARSFLIPSSFSMLSQVVPRKDLPAAAAWLSTGFHASAIGSPAIAGLIYGGYGAHGAWLFPVFLTISAFIMLNLIPKLRPLERQPSLSAVKSIQEGWAFIRNTPVLLAAMSLDMLAVLFGGAVALLPAYAAEVLHVGAQGLGALRAAPAAGAIFIALLLAVRPMKAIPARMMLWVVAGFGVCMIGFGLSTQFATALFFLSLSGVFDSVSVSIRSTLTQLLTPDHMRGRVSSVNSMFIISSNELGAFESGAMAKLFGLVPSIIIGGVGTLAVAAFTALKVPTLRHIVVNAEEEKIEKA